MWQIPKRCQLPSLSPSSIWWPSKRHLSFLMKFRLQFVCFVLQSFPVLTQWSRFIPPECLILAMVSIQRYEISLYCYGRRFTWSTSCLKQCRDRCFDLQGDYCGRLSVHVSLVLFFLCCVYAAHAVWFCLSAVQKNVEQGAVTFVGDESLREPGVRIHLYYLSR